MTKCAVCGKETSTFWGPCDDCNPFPLAFIDKKREAGWCTDCHYLLDRWYRDD